MSKFPGVTPFIPRKLTDTLPASAMISPVEDNRNFSGPSKRVGNSVSGFSLPWNNLNNSSVNQIHTFLAINFERSLKNEIQNKFFKSVGIRNLLNDDASGPIPGEDYGKTIVKKSLE